MTPKQRHREQAFALAADDNGHVSCILAGYEGHECGGRLQAHHSVASVQTLRRLHGQAFYALMAHPRPGWATCFRGIDLDTLIADGRNSAVCCELAHRQIELGKFTPEPSEHEVAFAVDYGLEHLLPAGLIVTTDREEA